MTTSPVPSITDEQIAEIEAEAKHSEADGNAFARRLHNTSLIALIARLRAAEKDAGRYQWIKECGPEEIDLVIENPGDDLDAAIDAAITEAKP